MSTQLKRFDAARVVMINEDRKTVMLHLGDGQVPFGGMPHDKTVMYIPETEAERAAITRNAYKPCQLVIFKPKYIHEATGIQYAERIEPDVFDDDRPIVPSDVLEHFVVSSSDTSLAKANQSKASGKSNDAKSPFRFGKVSFLIALGAIFYILDQYI